MAKTIDELVVRIKADTKQLQEALKKTKESTGKSKKGFLGMGAALKAMKGPLKAVAIGLAAFGAVITPIARVGMEFENLKLSLNTVFGSISQGKQAFAQVKKFATESPFQIKDLTKAFIQLKSAGIQPTEKMFKTFADASSVAIDSLGAFEALVRITQRSMGGGLGLEELTQISDRGIPVFEILRQKLGKTRLQITEMGQTAEGAALIMAALSEGLDERFGGAVAAKMETLTQKISNMNDAFSGLADTIFTELGVGAALKAVTGLVGEAAISIDNFIQRQTSGQSQDFLDAKDTRERQSVLADEQAEDQSLMDASNNAQFAGLLGLGSGGDSSQTSPEIAKRRNIQKRMEARALLILKLDGDLINERLALEKQGRNKSEAAAEQATNDALAKAATDRKKLLADASSTAMSTEDPIVKAKADLAELKAILDGGIATELAATFKHLDPDSVIAQLTADIAEMERKVVATGESVKAAGFTEEFGHVRDVIESTVTPLSKLKAIIAEINEMTSDNPDALKKMLLGTGMSLDEVLVILNARLTSLNEKVEEVSDTLGTQLQQAVTNSANAFTSNFVNALMEGKNALGSFKDFAKSMVSQIISIFLQMAVVNEILNAVFNLKGDAAFSTLRDNASGGHYDRGKPMLVGERGPELIIPNSSGSVMNGMNTKNAMGGGSTIIVNQSLNFSTGVVGTVRAEINKMMPTIAEVSKSAVLDASRRGGNYRKGLLGA